ncbi:MAG: hypothetical protein R2828_07510 [Saprospiraceae bacterium]
MRITILVFACLTLLGCTDKQTVQTEKAFKTLTGSRWKYDGEAMLKLLNDNNSDGKIVQRMERNIRQMEGGQFLFNPDGRLQIILPQINIRGDWSIEEGATHLNMKIDGSMNVKLPILTLSPEKIELGMDSEKVSFPRVFVPVTF